MRRVVNGKEVDIRSNESGTVWSEDVRKAAGIPSDRSLVLQAPGGGNRLVPSSGNFVFPEDYSIADVPSHKRGGAHSAPFPTLLYHIDALSYACPVDVSEDGSHIKVHDVHLPTGYNLSRIPILIEIPPDYPLSPPGVGSHRIFVPSSLRYHGRKPGDLHEGSNFRDDPYWAWWCYENIKWDPNYDDLIVLIEMIRADMKNPKT